MLLPKLFQAQCTCVILCIQHAFAQKCISLASFVGFISILQVPQNESCIKINNDLFYFNFLHYIIPGCWGFFYSYQLFQIRRQLSCFAHSGSLKTSKQNPLSHFLFMPQCQKVVSFGFCFLDVLDVFCVFFSSQEAV